jgi:hypothetical protein
MIIIIGSKKIPTSLSKLLSGYCYKLSKRVWCLESVSLLHNLKINFRRNSKGDSFIIVIRSLGGRVRFSKLSKTTETRLNYADYLLLISDP